MKKTNVEFSAEKLAEIFSDITDPEVMIRFLSELLTSKELADLSLRWELLEELYRGDTQRAIASRHHISLCKITRGSKLLKDDNSIVKKILDEKRKCPESK